MKLEFIEIELEWPYELKLFDLKNYILSNLVEYGDPLRWAITSVTSDAEKKNPVLSVEVVLIINQAKEQGIHPDLNFL